MVVKSRESERKEIILEKKSNATELMRRISMEKKKKKIGTAIQFRFLPVAPNLRNSAVRFLFSTARSLIKKYQSL